MSSINVQSFLGILPIDGTYLSKVKKKPTSCSRSYCSHVVYLDLIKFHGKALYSPIELHRVKRAPANVSPTQQTQLQHNREERGLDPVKLHGGVKRLAVP
jgi:hypothetical protein